MLTRQTTTLVREANRFTPGSGGNKFDHHDNPFNPTSNSEPESKEDGSMDDQDHEEDAAARGHFHAVLATLPSEPDNALYMAGYDAGCVDLARRMAGMEPELTWYPFTGKQGARATSLDGFQAFVVESGDEYTWWVDSPRTGAVVARGAAEDADDARVAVGEFLTAHASVAPLDAVTSYVIEHNPEIEPTEAVRLAKAAQRMAWQVAERPVEPVPAKTAVAKIPARPGWYVTCPNRDRTGGHHTQSNGPKVTRAKCEACGGALTSEPSYWGVTQWKSGGGIGYDPKDVVAWFSSDEAAWAAAKARTDDGGQGGWIDHRWTVEELKGKGLL